MTYLLQKVAVRVGSQFNQVDNRLASHKPNHGNRDVQDLVTLLQCAQITILGDLGLSACLGRFFLPLQCTLKYATTCFSVFRLTTRLFVLSLSRDFELRLLSDVGMRQHFDTIGMK